MRSSTYSIDELIRISANAGTPGRSIDEVKRFITTFPPAVALTLLHHAEQPLDSGLGELAQAEAELNATDEMRERYIYAFSPTIAIALLHHAKTSGVKTLEIIEVPVTMTSTGKPQYDA